MDDMHVHTYIYQCTHIYVFMRTVCAVPPHAHAYECMGHNEYSSHPTCLYALTTVCLSLHKRKVIQHQIRVTHEACAHTNKQNRNTKAHDILQHTHAFTNQRDAHHIHTRARATHTHTRTHTHADDIVQLSGFSLRALASPSTVLSEG